MFFVVVLVFVLPFPIPQSPHKTPGKEKNSQPKQAFMQPKPFVFPLVTVSETA
jgi:hypothetical protein